MDEGYVADRGDANFVNVPEWVEGAPEERRFLGMNAGVTTGAHERIPVVTLRCARCGLLRSYAPGPVT
ncbi:MAG TPA: hypothetical protein VE913_07235 [Longimicrobium sp.]|nr:hypothetical protein [Longimicrobium sp.]